MKELSVFVDESGDLGGESRYYLLTLVFHDQSNDLSRTIELYEQSLESRGLPNTPFHFNPLLRANERYSDLDASQRSKLLMSFNTFAQHTPFSYHVFAYRKDRYESADKLVRTMKRDLTEFLFDNLDTFTEFDLVKIYYDDGQPLITRILHAAFEYALFKSAVLYREAHPAEYRMFQVADFACGIELTALKYGHREETSTDRRFFGQWRDFKKNYLRKLRRKLLGDWRSS